MPNELDKYYYYRKKSSNKIRDFITNNFFPDAETFKFYMKKIFSLYKNSWETSKHSDIWNLDKKKVKRIPMVVAEIRIKINSLSLINDFRGMYNKLIEIVERESKLKKGVIESINANCITISWNSIKEFDCPCQNGIECLLKIKKMVKKIPDILDLFDLKMFIFSGIYHFGNVGTSNIMRQIIFSKFNYLILKFMELYKSETDILIITSEDTISGINYELNYDILDYVSYNKKKFKLYLIDDFFKQRGINGELVYVMKSSKHSKMTLSETDDYWNFIEKEEFEKARETLDSYESNMDLKNILYERCKNEISVRILT